jgi:malate dehydrogenase (quinone)
VNSKATNNSQTIHCGDIETNYTLEKALRVKRTAEMIVHYAELLDGESRERCVFRTPKMVLAVGAKECAVLRQRFECFSPHFPAMELLEKPQIAEWEPAVALAKGQLRPEELLAIGIRRTYTAVDYGQLSESFLHQAQTAICAANATAANAAAINTTAINAANSRQATAGLPAGDQPPIPRSPAGERRLDLHLGTTVQQIQPEGELFRVTLAPTPGCQRGQGQPRQLLARHVVVNAGAHSLLMAQRMGWSIPACRWPAASTSRPIYFRARCIRYKTTNYPSPPSMATRMWAPPARPALAPQPYCCRCWSATNRNHSGSFYRYCGWIGQYFLYCGSCFALPTSATTS